MNNTLKLFTLLLSLCKSRSEVLDLLVGIASDNSMNDTDFTLCYTKAISRLNTL